MATKPERLKRLEAVSQQYLGERDARPNPVPASEVIANDLTLRPFSLRLTAQEIVRLKAAAPLLGVKPTELLRRFLLDGLARIEASTPLALDQAQAMEALAKIMQVVQSLGMTATPPKAKSNGPRKGRSTVVGKTAVQGALAFVRQDESSSDPTSKLG